jgi:hypothetical protein
MIRHAAEGLAWRTGAESEMRADEGIMHGHGERFLSLRSDGPGPCPCGAGVRRRRLDEAAVRWAATSQVRTNGLMGPVW